MKQQMYLTAQNIIAAKKKLDEAHKKFSKPGERDAVYDFARMLKLRISRGTAQDFITAYDKAVNDLSDENKMSEIYDEATKGFIHDMVSFIAKYMFGANFAEEVKNISYKSTAVL